MTDIVERLRDQMITYHNRHLRNTKFYNDQRNEAADEIERLRAENENLRKRVELWEPSLTTKSDGIDFTSSTKNGNSHKYELSSDSKTALKRIDKAMNTAQNK